MNQNINEAAPRVAIPRRGWAGTSPGVRLLAGLLIAITAAFLPRLIRLVTYAAASDLDSYLLLVPFISAYLLFVRRSQLKAPHRASPVIAILLVLAAAAAWWVSLACRTRLGENDLLSVSAFSYLLAIYGTCFLCLGRTWMRQAAFPMSFLLFIIPLPGAAVDLLETWSKIASCSAAEALLGVFGVPALRHGTIFEMPLLTIRVAQECSGIHSSLVLCIASMVAADLILTAPWRRAVLVAFSIPLGVIRNGFRIATLGWLCTNVDPGIINSPLHHQGGPIFFTISLVPLFALLFVLQLGERRRSRRKRVRDLPGKMAAS